jgi:predicted dehydrogenase
LPPIRFALLGCGRIGHRHAQLMQQYGTLVAVADTDAAAANHFSTTFGVPAFYSADALFAQGQAQVVAICTPNGLHARHSIAALRAGLHVLCEKPMAIASEDAQAMVEAAQQTGNQLFIVKQNRFNPPVQAVKQLLDTGMLGRMLSVQLNCFWNRQPGYYAQSWKGTRSLDGGTLYTQFSHFIDLLVWFFGPLHLHSALLQNMAHGGVVEFEDCGVVLGSLADGAPLGIHYTVNAYQKNMEGSITIFAENGTVKIGGQYLNEIDYQLVKGYSIQNLATGNPPNQYGTYTGSMSNHPQVYANLLQVLSGHGQMINSLADAVETVRFIEAVYAMAGL